MDRDTGPIGGLERPPPPPPELFRVTIFLDLLAVALAFLVSPLFGLLMPLYIGASKAYSYRRIRLKKYAVAGYATVILFQGALTFWLVWYGSHSTFSTAVPWMPMAAAACLIGGFYPLTQIYQHEQDKQDGVVTLSARLGYRGTFLFSSLIYVIAFALITIYFVHIGRTDLLAVVAVLFGPIIVYFLRWMHQVWQDKAAADFRHMMRMNWLASCCTNLAFLILLILK